MRTLINRLISNETGQVLPIVLVALAIGSLLIGSSLNFVATNLHTQIIVEENIKAVYAAEAGIEDAFYNIRDYYASASSKADPMNVTYILPETINNMEVEVNIQSATHVFVGGEYFDDVAVHEFLLVEKDITTDGPPYTYTINMTNYGMNGDGTGNIKIALISVELSRYVTYIEDSTSGNVTSEDPVIIGDNATGITLKWELGPPRFEIEAGETVSHYFLLDGPPGLNIRSSLYIDVAREDVSGATDVYPYKIVATARDREGDLQARLTVGAWLDDYEINVRNWQIIP